MLKESDNCIALINVHLKMLRFYLKYSPCEAPSNN
jgi:hypothetical protein